MNKLTKQSLNMTSDFGKFLRSLFDNNEEVASEYSKHSSCNVTLVADVDIEWATDLVNKYGLSIEPSVLVGHWMIEAVSDYSWGIEWSCVSEAVRVKEVTKTVTKTVTQWIPIEDENPVSEVPCTRPQARSK